MNLLSRPIERGSEEKDAVKGQGACTEVSESRRPRNLFIYGFLHALIPFMVLRNLGRPIARGTGVYGVLYGVRRVDDRPLSEFSGRSRPKRAVRGVSIGIGLVAGMLERGRSVQ